MLADLECGDTPTILVCNKADQLEQLPQNVPDDTVYISAKHGDGIDTMLLKITEILDQSIVHTTAQIPYDKMDLLNFLHANGNVLSEEYTETGLIVTFELDAADYGTFLSKMPAQTP